MCEGGGNCLKYLKRGWDRKEGRGHKDFKKGGKLGQGVGTLKGGGGGWNLLMNYGKSERTYQCMHVQNHVYANKSKCMYVCDVCDFSNPRTFMIF